MRYRTVSHPASWRVAGFTWTTHRRPTDSDSLPSSPLQGEGTRTVTPEPYRRGREDGGAATESLPLQGGGQVRVTLPETRTWP
jgi:hypothetical protein